MSNYKKHLIKKGASVREALVLLNELALDAILFVVDSENKLIGSLTDGDIRRGLIKGQSLESDVGDFIQPKPKYVQKGNYDINQIIAFRKNNYKILPVLDSDNRLVNVVNFRTTKSYLPIDVLIMAGGRGSRLRPLTDTVPKPLLTIGDKPIIEHNLDRLVSFGVDDFWISLCYLGEQIESYFGNGSTKSINIQYVWEKTGLGTIGAIKKIEEFRHDYILVTNSDILTNLDYEDFFLHFLEKEADLAVVSIPYSVDIPYAVLETNNGMIHSFKEKPTYTYYSNGGIYLMKKSVIDHIPNGIFYNATDLLQYLIDKGDKVVTYPLTGYWLDIGKHEDFAKAQRDIKMIKF